MTANEDKTNEAEGKTGRVNLGNLESNEETVKDLTDSEQREIKGGTGGVANKPSSGPGSSGYSIWPADRENA